MKTAIIIPKGKGNLQGIGLLELLWKMAEIILNFHLGMTITFHIILHGF